MTETDFKKMVLGFRVSDLQVLLGFAGRNKNGKKNELQKRALDLIKLNSQPVQVKIRELHKRRYQQTDIPLSDPQDLGSYGTGNPSMSSGYTSNGSHGIIAAGRLPSNFPVSRNNVSINLRQPLNVPQYAIFPDVKFKDLPFYDILGELLKPSTLMPLPGERFQERDFIFHLTPHQAHKLESEPDVRVQLRFCLLETSCEQEDNFPSSICVKVNSKLATLPNPIPTNKPGVEPKRPSRPVDITALCRLTPAMSNDILVSWAPSYGRVYVVAVYLVHKQSSAVLINRLKANGVRNPDHTTAIIKEKLCQDKDSEIATMSLKGSLLCPLGKIRMMLPCRALTCSHLQCFDATLYVQMNEKKPKWICPVCDKPALFKDLAIDGLFLDIATKAPEVSSEVQFHEDGSWTPIMPVKKVQEVNDSLISAVPKKEVIVSKPKERPSIEIISLDSDSDTEESWPVQECETLPPPAKKLCKPIGNVSPNNASAASVSLTTKMPENISGTFSEKPVLSVNPVAPLDMSVGSILSNKSTGAFYPPKKGEKMNMGSLEITPISISPINVYNTNNTSQSSHPTCAPVPGSFTGLERELSGTQSLSSMGNFDLFSLIQQNQSFIPVKDTKSQNQVNERDNKSPDIISID